MTSPPDNGTMRRIREARDSGSFLGHLCPPGRSAPAGDVLAQFDALARGNAE
jgi:hypothetical protein